MSGALVLARPARGRHRLAAAGVRSPTRAGYWMAAGITVVGFLISLTWSMSGTLSAWAMADGFTRVRSPGAMPVEISKSGTYFVYLEGASAATFDPFDVMVISPDGTRVTVVPYEGQMRYEVPATGVAGAAVASFGAHLAGTYLVLAAVVPAHGSIAVGPSVAQTGSGGISVGAIATLAAALAAAVVLTALTMKRRLPYRTPSFF